MAANVLRAQQLLYLSQPVDGRHDRDLLPAQYFAKGEAWDAGNLWVRLALLLKDVLTPAVWFQRAPFDYLGTLRFAMIPTV